MKKCETVGECVRAAADIASTEMNAAYDELGKSLPREDGLNSFIECGKHMAQAIDAILTGAASFGGDDNKMDVLLQALEGHNFKVTYTGPARS